MRHGWMGATLLLALTAPAHAQLGDLLAEAVGQADRQPLQLAGIRVGMPSAEVGPALQAAGYRRNQSGDGPSWEGTVARLAAQRSVRLPIGGQVTAWESFVKGAERVEVRYRPTPAGAVVHEVSYTITADALAPQRLRALLLARYGRSSWDNGAEFLYCTRGERVCNLLAHGQGLQLPSVFVRFGGMQHTI
ncbi:MAG TPA: hypothetical protein VF614_14250, partial [Chthoniobacteraceae bacterium]